MKNLKNILKISALSLAIGTGVLNCGLFDNKKVEQEIKRYDMEITERVWINGMCLEYDGMIGIDTFSVSYPEDSAVNIYYPANSKDIHIKRNDFKVIEVTPEHLVIEK